MYNDLRMTIQNIVGEGQADDLIDALYAFEEISYQDHILPIQQAMGMKEENGSDWFITSIRTICVDNLISIIKTMGVFFDDDQDVSLDQLTQVFTCLVRIERYPFKETLFYIIDNSANAIEAFDDLLAEFHGSEYTSLVEIFDKVSPELLEKLKDLCLEEMRLQEDEPVQSAPLSKEYLDLLSILSFNLHGIQNWLFDKLSEGSMLISMPSSAFYQEMVKNIIDLCEIEDLKNFPVEKHLAVAKLIYTYTMIGYIKDAREKTVDKNLASKIYSLIDSLQEDVIGLDETIQPDRLADGLVEVFKQLSVKLAEKS